MKKIKMWELLVLVLVVGGAIGQYLLGVRDQRKARRTEQGLRAAITDRDADISDLTERVGERDQAIAELERRANIIQSLELHINIDANTPHTTVGEVRPGLGLSSAVALFAEDGTRFRFVTDGTFYRQQITPTTQRISFVYRPETPTQILGRPIGFLHRMKTFVCNYSDFFRQIGFSPTGEPAVFHTTVLLNGVEVLVLRERMADAVALATSQLQMSIEGQFRQLDERYKERIKAAQN